MLCRVLCEVFNYKSSVLITMMACTMPVYFSVLVQTVGTVYFQCFMCTNVETCMLNIVYCSRNSCD